MKNLESKIELDSSGAMEKKIDVSEPETILISEAVSDKNRFFHRVKVEKGGVSQITNVTVQILPEKADEPITGCFKAMWRCFK